MPEIIFLVALMLGSLVYVLIIRKRKNSKYYVPNKIKKTYEKFAIPIDKLHILCRDYFEDEESNAPLFAKVADSLYDNNKNVTVAQKYISVITYNFFKYHGKEYNLKSIPIDLSDSEIMELLKKERFVDVYFDRNDPQNNFFDLSFVTRQ